MSDLDEFRRILADNERRLLRPLTKEERGEILKALGLPREPVEIEFNTYEDIYGNECYSGFKVKQYKGMYSADGRTNKYGDAECVNLSIRDNTIHVCDLAEFIDFLIALEQEI